MKMYESVVYVYITGAKEGIPQFRKRTERVERTIRQICDYIDNTYKDQSKVSYVHDWCLLVVQFLSSD